MELSEIDKLIIFGNEWEVAELSELEEGWGLCWKDERRIEVVKHDIPDFDADTLIHEIFHALWYSYQAKPKLPEEEAVAILASGLIGVLKANPNLLDYLQSALH